MKKIALKENTCVAGGFFQLIISTHPFTCANQMNNVNEKKNDLHSCAVSETTGLPILLDKHGASMLVLLFSGCSHSSFDYYFRKKI
jgi:hypothetical protein